MHIKPHKFSSKSVRNKLLLFFFFTNVLAATCSDLDSLFMILKTSKEKDMAAIYNEIGFIYAMNHSLDTAILYTNKAYSLATRFKNLNDLGNVMDNLGYIYRFKSDFKNQVKYKLKAAEYYLQAKNHKQYAAALNDIGSGYHSIGDQDKAIEYYYKSYEINEKHRFIKGIAINLNNIGDLYYDVTDYKKAIQCYEKILSISNHPEVAKILPATHTNMGSVYSVWGKHDSAIANYDKALKFIEGKNDHQLKADLYNNIGCEYRLWEKYDRALEFFKLALSTDIDISYDINIVSDYNNIGLCYLAQNKYTLAEEQFKKEYNLAVKINQPFYQALALGNLSRILHKKGQYSEAMSLINQEIDLIEKNELVGLTAKAHQLKGRIYLALKNYSSSIETYRKCLGYAITSGDHEVIMNVYKLMSDAYKESGNSDSALAYFQLYTQIKDSVFTIEQHNSLAEYEVNFGLKQKEEEITILKKEENALTEKLEKQKVWLVLLLLGIAGIIILSFLLFRKYKRNKKINLVLAEQSKLLTKKLDLLQKRNESAETVKYKSSLLTTDDIEEIFAKAITSIEDFDIYLDSKITLPWLAEKLNVLPNHLSQVINQKTNQNFNDFINYYRVKEAKNRLLDIKYSNFTIEAVGKSVGFNSKTTFINAFKKFEQTYPSKYKKHFFPVKTTNNASSD